MSPLFYKVLHLTGIFMLFIAYGGLIVRAIYAPDDRSIRRLGAITSGIGLLLLLVSGFGLIAKLQYGWPVWVFVKMGIWLALGAMMTAINRKPTYAQSWWWVTIILGILAAIVGLYKPF